MSGSGGTPVIPIPPASTADQPGWYPGYVPSAIEWNNWWSNKIDVDNPIMSTGPWLSLSGGTMLGAITLAGPPTSALQAATKAYVDALTPAAGPFLPMAGGTMTGALILNTDPVQPLGAVTKQYADQINSLASAAQGTANAAVKRMGDTMTGALILSGDPTQALGACTRQYADRMLPLAGGTVTGALVVNGQFNAQTNAYIVGTLFLQPYNNWEWGFSTDSSGNHIQTFRANWYNEWSTANGTRSWNGPGGSLMNLDGNGNLNVQNSINTNTMSASVVNGNAGTINGSFTVQQTLTANSIMSNSGMFYIGGNTNYYLGRGSDASWRFVENGIVNSVLDTGGNLQVRGNITQSGGGIYSGSSGFTAGGDVQMNNHWIYSCGQITMVGNIDMGGHNVINCPGVVPPSDIRFKTNVTYSMVRGLEVLERVELVQFDMFDQHYPIGFIANDLPEALAGKHEDYRYVEPNAMMAALVSAVQELAARVERLEAR